MTLDEAIRDFATAGDALPQAAMGWALDHWEAAGPRLAALVRDYADGTDASEQTERALFLALHLLAERRETAAFQPLCRLLANAETADLVLGNALSETLCGLLISLFDGDPAPLQALVEPAASDGLVREAALLALAYLTRTGRWPAEAMRSYLRRLRHELPHEGGMVWVGWVLAVAHLGYADLAGEAEGLIRAGLVEDALTEADFWRALRHTQEDPSGMAGFDADGIGPFTDAVGGLSDWYGEGMVQTPVINPLRHVGRNDPCPCGSGKKHKKCCLG